MRFLQCRNRLVQARRAQVRVPELEQRHRVPGIDRQLALAERDRLVQLSPEERHLAEQVVRARNSRILLQRAFQFGFRERLHLEANHHLRREEMSRRGLRFDAGMCAPARRVPRRAAGSGCRPCPGCSPARDCLQPSRASPREAEWPRRSARSGSSTSRGPAPPPDARRFPPESLSRTERQAVRSRPCDRLRGNTRHRADRRPSGTLSSSVRSFDDRVLRFPFVDEGPRGHKRGFSGHSEFVESVVVCPWLGAISEAGDPGDPEDGRQEETERRATRTTRIHRLSDVAVTWPGRFLL